MNEKTGGFGNRKPISETPMTGASAPPPEAPASSDQTETAGADDDELMRLFVGKNFEKFERVREKMKLGNRSALGWCWTAFFLPMVWLLYRKLYIEAAVIFVLPIVIAALFPDVNFANAGIFVAVAMAGKSYYLGRAQKKIDKIMAMAEPEDVKLELLRRAGGVSWPAAIIGLAIVASAIGLAIWAETASA